MNKERRKKIEEIAVKLDALQTEITEVQSEEQDTFDNMPENLQQGEKADAMQAAIDSMEDAISHLDDAINALGEIE